MGESVDKLFEYASMVVRSGCVHLNNGGDPGVKERGACVRNNARGVKNGMQILKNIILTQK
jgi:hypothetical protein